MHATMISSYIYGRRMVATRLHGRVWDGSVLDGIRTRSKRVDSSVVYVLETAQSCTSRLYEG